MKSQNNNRGPENEQKQTDKVKTKGCAVSESTNVYKVVSFIQNDR